MGWRDAPLVTEEPPTPANQPAWMSAPVVSEGVPEPKKGGRTGLFLSEDAEGKVGPGVLLQPFAAGMKLMQHGYQPQATTPISTEEHMPDVEGIRQAVDAAPAGLTSSLGLGVFGRPQRLVAGSPKPAAESAPEALQAAEATGAGPRPLAPKSAQAATLEAAQAQQALGLESQVRPVVPVAEGGPNRVVTPDGSMEIAAKPEIVELDSLRLARGDLQPRDRGRAEYDVQARERATRLDPEQLRPSRLSDSGAPIVLADGTVISGNGRVMSINEVYASEALKDRAAAYKASLGPEAEKMSRPVLIMRAEDLTPEDAARFADLSNRGRVSAMSATERAGRDAKALGPESMAMYQGGELDAPQNWAFRQAFMSRAVTAAERPSISANNQLSREGAERMRAAVLHAAYEDAPVLARMVESTDDNIRNITGALLDAAPQVLRMKADIKTGVVPKEMDPTASVAEAVRIIGDLRNRGISPAQYLAQADAFKTSDALADHWIRAFYNEELTHPLSRQKMAAVLQTYAEEAGKKRAGGLFEDATSPGDVLAMSRMRNDLQDPQRRVAGSAVNEAEGPQGNLAAGVGQGIRQGGPAVQGQPPGAGVDRAAPRGAEGAGQQGAAAAGSAGEQGARDQAVASLGPLAKKEGRGSAPIVQSLRDSVREAGTSGPSRRDVAGAAAHIGVDVPNVVGRGPFAQGFAAGLSGTIAGTPLVAASRKTVSDLGRAATEIAKRYSDAGAFSAGEAARDAMTEWLTGRAAEVSQRLYSNVTKMVSASATRPLPMTKVVMDGLTGRQMAAASKVYQPAIDLVSEALARPQGLTFQGIMDLRTQIGWLIDRTIEPQAGTPMPALKRLYGALTEDLRSAASKLGGDRAVKAFDTANGVQERVAARRSALAKIIGKSGDASGEQALDRLIAAAGTKGGADVQRLLLARRAAGAEAWDGVAAAAVERLGRNQANDFSPAIFVKNYNALSENGRNILFKSTGKDDLKRALDDVATVASKLDELTRLGNPSGTARAMTVGTILGGAGGFFVNPLLSLVPALGVGGGYIVARMMARPMTARSAARWGTAYLNHATTPTNATTAMLNLATKNLASAMAQEGLGEEAELEQKLNAALQPQGEP